MRFKTHDDFLSVVAAFQQGWLALLRDEQITTDNIESKPVLLMTAILEQAAIADLSETDLAKAGLERLKQFERDLLEAPALH